VSRRYFLDWSEACLAAACRWIIERFGPHSARAGAGDLTGLTILTTGRRAGRQFLHMLVERCGGDRRALIPPRVMTPGDFVDAVTGADRAGATPSERRLAWMQALQRLDAHVLAPLVPVPPQRDDLGAWLGLARTIERLHSELAGERRSFDDAAAVAAEVETMFAEVERFNALAAAHTEYSAILNEAGLDDPHILRERALSAGLGAGESPDAVALIAVVEMNAVQRAVLEALGDRVHALIHAPESLADRFDEFGCLRIESWRSAAIDLRQEQLIVCDRPADQSQAVLRRIAGFGGRHAAPRITIGLGDESLGDQIQRDARWAGLSMHAAAGVPVDRSPPFRLLAAIGEWLEDARFSRFAALVRHPDLERWLAGRLGKGPARRGAASWLTVLDRYFADHLHERFSGAWLGGDAETSLLRAVHDAVSGLLEPLAGPPRSPARWAGPVLEVLRGIYSAADLDGGLIDALTLDACRSVRDQLAVIARARPSLMPEVTAPQAIAHLLDELADGRLPADAGPDQIEMLGWLELHLDPAPALIIAGVNDGLIPQAVHGDAFLPDSLRRRLGLMHNARRYARDAYLLQAMVQSREAPTLISGRRARDGAPLAPSRLLMACDDQTVKRRIDVFCAEPDEHAAPLPHGAPPPAAISSFDIPPLPPDLPPPQKMSVTDFRLYLQCPYRYALQRLLKLQAFGDDMNELDPLQFGGLAHGVLEAFGSEPDIRDADEPETIAAFLAGALDDLARQRFGAAPLPAVRVQISRLELRLAGFAQFQARLRRDGWAIHRCEWTFEDGAALDLPGEASMPISGKIDRIDRHEGTGRWRIIDYKTGDNPSGPDHAHVGRTRFEAGDELAWRDLQLPLYRHFAAQHGIDGDVELTYLLLPKQSDGVRCEQATWSAGQLAAAVETAREVVRRIRRGEFPINAAFESPSDDYRRICQTAVFKSARAAAGADAEATT